MIWIWYIFVAMVALYLSVTMGGLLLCDTMPKLVDMKKYCWQFPIMLVVSYLLNVLDPNVSIREMISLLFAPRKTLLMAYSVKDISQITPTVEADLDRVTRTNVLQKVAYILNKKKNWYEGICFSYTNRIKKEYNIPDSSHKEQWESFAILLILLVPLTLYFRFRLFQKNTTVSIVFLAVFVIIEAGFAVNRLLAALIKPASKRSIIYDTTKIKELKKGSEKDKASLSLLGDTQFPDSWIDDSRLTQIIEHITDPSLNKKIAVDVGYSSLYYGKSLLHLCLRRPDSIGVEPVRYGSQAYIVYGTTPTLNTPVIERLSFENGAVVLGTRNRAIVQLTHEIAHFSSLKYKDLRLDLRVHDDKIFSQFVDNRLNMVISLFHNDVNSIKIPITLLSAAKYDVHVIHVTPEKRIQQFSTMIDEIELLREQIQKLQSRAQLISSVQKAKRNRFTSFASLRAGITEGEQSVIIRSTEESPVNNWIG